MSGSDQDRTLGACRGRSGVAEVNKENDGISTLGARLDHETIGTDISSHHHKPAV